MSQTLRSVHGRRRPESTAVEPTVINVDELDHRILHALRLDGRVAFSRIAEVLDVSTQTVTRRYRRLSSEMALRVVGVVNPQRTYREQWILRLTASPGAAQRVAQSLARRDDTTWVRRMSGGNEICFVTITSSAAHHSLLFREIPSAASITEVSAHRLLHTYLGGPTAWRGHTAALTEGQQKQLRQALDAADGTDGREGLASLTRADWRLLTTLQRDGRVSYADLAAQTGLSPSTVTRRLAALQADAILSFDVEIGPEAYGITTQVLLWISVAPAHLNRVAAILITHWQIAFLAATTGPTNLVALVLCRTPAELHDYLANGLSALDAIRVLETSPVQETLKTCSPFLPR